MSTIGFVVAALVGLVVLVVGKVMLDMISKEIEGRLPGLCFAVLRLARWRLPEDLRAELHDEALLEEELRTILFHTYKEKPITGLTNGLRFAFGCLVAARRNARAAGWTSHRHTRVSVNQGDGNAQFLAQPMLFTALALAHSPRSASRPQGA